MKTFLRLQKTSWRRLDQDKYIHHSHSSSEDAFKTSCENVFKTSARRLAKTSSKRLQDVCENVSKTSSRRLQDVFKTLSRRFQDIFKRSYKDAFKMFWSRIIRLNCLPSSRVCLGHTSEKFMVSVENLQVWYILAWFEFCTLLHLSVAAYRGVFRTLSNIYKGAFLWKYLTALSC